MIFEIDLETPAEDFISITDAVTRAVSESRIGSGFCVVYCPHTTAGITINENADPDVVQDMLCGLEKAFPDRGEFLHAEGNSAAHLKASAIGSSVTLIIHDGRLLLGPWQGIWFCEFDGPRSRKFLIKISGE